jgi:D-alanyl-D-alanine carboxypeptidase/D-alanyl-D-alanine-endopeptidase (penicillin-binding protein 4)
VLSLVNRTTTIAKGGKRELSVYRALGQNSLEVSGQMPVDDRGYTAGVGVSRPAAVFVEMLRNALNKRGVTIVRRSRTLDARAVGGTTQATTIQPPPQTPTNTSAPGGPQDPTLLEIASLPSPPFSVIVAQTLKPSQNLYTELILRTLGKVAAQPSTTARTSEGAGLEVVKNFLRQAGVGLGTELLVQTDGSGLSRNDMVTANATVQLLTYMSRHRYAAAFRDALPIAGVDGTLRNRFKGTPAENNVRAKTGTLSSASSLSGYVTTAAGERLVFSVMVNNYPPSTSPTRSCTDPIAVMLASFAGRS